MPVSQFLGESSDPNTFPRVTPLPLPGAGWWQVTGTAAQVSSNLGPRHPEGLGNSLITLPPAGSWAGNSALQQERGPFLWGSGLHSESVTLVCRICFPILWSLKTLMSSAEVTARLAFIDSRMLAGAVTRVPSCESWTGPGNRDKQPQYSNFLWTPIMSLGTGVQPWQPQVSFQGWGGARHLNTSCGHSQEGTECSTEINYKVPHVTTVTGKPYNTKITHGLHTPL